jgi:hypothetical protein
MGNLMVGNPPDQEIQPTPFPPPRPQACSILRKCDGLTPIPFLNIREKGKASLKPGTTDTLFADAPGACKSNTLRPGGPG